ncbi:Zinc finger CCHC domain-containing protein 3 [Holothuria leucospilota]|uniref:Zinc finger CCHC domain-containing protein 3 n=1 Tax=Holothuria leucospilota TaxID=206669 RepID=A0A9Q1B932_HOLLE|nr:Zinc finger CCHC domain-containing protein 3 [Holothuria leucospilota]
MRKFFPPLSRANGYTVSPYTNSATTVVTVLYVPHELDDNVVRFVLGKYGNVVCGRFVTFADYPHVYNGKRQYQIQLHSDIPSSIRLGGRNCWVRYYGQPRTCLKCGGKGHNVKDCQETVCFKCQSLGHIAKECVAEIKCSVCEKVGHSHKECPVSFANKINPAPLRWIASNAEIDGCEDESDEAETVAVTNPTTLQNTQGAEANTAENTSVIETHMEVDMESQSQSQSLFKCVQGTLLPNPPTCEHELVSKQTAEQKESQIAMDTSKEQLPISLSAEEPKVHSPLNRDTEEVDKHVAHPVVSDACASVPPSTNNPEEVDTNIESQALTESTREQLPTSPSTEKPVDQSPLPPSEQGSTPVTLPTENGADRSAYKLKSTFFTESTAKESKSSKDSEDWVTIRRGRSTSQPASRNQRLSRSRSNIRVPFEDPSDSVRMTQIFLEDEPWHSCYLKGCRETFSSFQGLKEHVSREHPKLKKRNYPCPRKSCKTVTNNPKEWILHIANEHPDFVIKHELEFFDRYFLKSQEV